MPSTITRPVAGRVTNDEAIAFRQQAARYGLTQSAAVGALIRRALDREVDALVRSAVETEREDA